MRSVLEELYYGNIQPALRSNESNPLYRQAVTLKSRNMEELEKTLNDSQKETLNKYLCAQGEMEGVIEQDTFNYALKLGVLLMAEVFINSGEVTGEDRVCL